MKKIILLLCVLSICSIGFAAPEKNNPTEKASPKQETPESVISANEKANPAKQTVAEEKSAFRARQKKIKKLVKQYKKASEEQKPAIKAELSQVVSQSVDAAVLYVKARIAAERANLDNWESKLQEDEKKLDQIKARRVEELLSGEAERKHKAAQKKWKKQMKEAEKELH